MRSSMQLEYAHEIYPSHVLRKIFQGVVTTQVGSNHSENLSRIIRRVNGYASSFSEKMQAMVHNLQSHTDTDCRFLAIRLSFSDYYKSKSRV